MVDRSENLQLTTSPVGDAEWGFFPPSEKSGDNIAKSAGKTLIGGSEQCSSQVTPNKLLNLISPSLVNASTNKKDSLMTHGHHASFRVDPKGWSRWLPGCGQSSTFLCDGFTKVAGRLATDSLYDSFLTPYNLCRLMPLMKALDDGEEVMETFSTPSLEGAL